MSHAEAAYVVNSVSAYAMVFAGLITIAFARMMTRQPWRWLAVYVCVALSGAATVWYHGFGGSFPSHVADLGASLLLVWMIMVAIVGDYYPGRGGRLLTWLVALVSLECVVALAVGGPQGDAPLVFSALGAFEFGELVLAVNCAIVAALVFARRRRIDPAARPLLTLTACLLLGGVLLAGASGRGIDLEILAYHAIWHVVGAFGFVALWAFNEMRFSLPEAAAELEEAVDEVEEWTEEAPPVEQTPPEPSDVQTPADREQVFSY